MKAVVTRMPPRRSEMSPRPIVLPRGLHDDFFPLKQFEEFYQEVVCLKSQLGGSTPLSAKETHECLLSLLGSQEDKVSTTSTLLGQEIYRHAQRIMACLADQIFSVQHWPSGDKWYSLEESLFSIQSVTATSADGEQSEERFLFDKLDLLLQQRDPTYRGLAAVYFYALMLGFHQERHKTHRKHSIDGYLDHLFHMISHGDNGTFSENNRLFEQAYSHTLVEAKIVNLPSPQKWFLLLACLIVTWIVVSSALWVQVSYPVSEKLQQVQRVLHQ